MQIVLCNDCSIEEDPPIVLCTNQIPYPRGWNIGFWHFHVYFDSSITRIQSIVDGCVIIIMMEQLLWWNNVSWNIFFCFVPFNNETNIINNNLCKASKKNEIKLRPKTNHFVLCTYSIQIMMNNL